MYVWNRMEETKLRVQEIRQKRTRGENKTKTKETNAKVVDVEETRKRRTQLVNPKEGQCRRNYVLHDFFVNV